MSDRQLKKLFWTLIGIGILLIIFIAIFNGCLFGIEPQRLETVDGVYSLLFAIFIPLLSSGYCFIFAIWKCKSFTKYNAIRQSEQQLRNGVITQEQFQNNVKAIETYDLEKKKMKALMEKDKVLFEERLKEEIQKEINNVKKDLE